MWNVTEEYVGRPNACITRSASPQTSESNYPVPPASKYPTTVHLPPPNGTMLASEMPSNWIAMPCPTTISCVPKVNMRPAALRVSIHVS